MLLMEMRRKKRTRLWQSRCDVTKAHSNQTHWLQEFAGLKSRIHRECFAIPLSPHLYLSNSQPKYLSPHLLLYLSMYLLSKADWFSRENQSKNTADVAI
jgi:hypothetical protein